MVNSHVCLYIAVVTFLCHSIRLVPTLWEMQQRFGLDPEEYPWPAWLEVVTVLSHLALTLSASISPYILPALYRANRNTRQQADLSVSYCKQLIILTDVVLVTTFPGTERIEQS